MHKLRRKEKVNLLKYIDIISYVLLINMSFYLLLKRKNSSYTLLYKNNTYMWLSITMTLLGLIFFYIYGLFTIAKKSLSDSIYSLGLSVVLMNLIIWLLTLFDKSFIYPRKLFLYLAILQFFTLGFWITFSWKIQKKLNPPINLMIIGNKADAENIIKKLSNQRNRDFYIKYLCNNIKILEDYIEQVDEIIICSRLLEEYREYIINLCIARNKELYIIPQIQDIAMTNTRLEEFDDMPVFKINSFSISFGNRVIKRIFDIIISSVSILILSPIMIVLAIIIKLYDNGSVLYKQERITKDNRPFKLYKFRTMIVDAEKYTGPVLAEDEDPRITPVGRFLRATRLDEIPQLFNVLKGDMSIVGPRPERAYFIEKFTKEMPEFKYRTNIKAGITGLAQVLGKYTTTPEDKLRYDLLYIKKYSLLLDFKILVQTIKVIFMKESSQGVIKDKSKEKLVEELDVKGLESSGIVKF